MSNERIRRGEYMYPPALTRDAANIVWGGFFLEVEQEDDKEAWRSLDDDKPPIGHRQDGRLRPIKINPVGGQPISPLFII